MGFPRSSTGKESTKCRKTQFNIWVRKIPWRRDRLPTPIFWGFPEGLDGKEFTCIARYLEFEAKPIDQSKYLKV